jgi:hypothetical protein
MFLTFSAEANDGAVETSAGGLQLRKEHKVLMEKERLFISRGRVQVEYEFRNTSRETVVSEVAFPIPTLEYVLDDTVGRRDFPDFKVWIDGIPVHVEKEVRAFVKKREVTEELRKAGITIETFGNFYPNENNNEIMKLRPATRNRLIKIGVLKAPDNKDSFMDYWPQWKTSIKYHWRQTFPPNTVVRIKHEYQPVAGYSPVQIQDFNKTITDSCIDANTIREMKFRVANAMKKKPEIESYFGLGWVNYILTTANTWQTPIKDFELVVQGDKDELITFCWDGPVEKIGKVKYRAHKKNFIPEKDLRVYFYMNRW